MASEDFIIDRLGVALFPEAVCLSLHVFPIPDPRQPR
jgi:hypothetical protein